jgi:hypothetical protein
MAEVVITTRVNNELVQKTVDTFSGLKKEIRNAKDELLKFAEGSEDFKRVQGNISKLQTSLKDLGDTAKIQGSGVERLQQSFNLLSEGFLTGDLEKGKVALTGLGQAVKAIPIFLLIEGIQLVIQNFDKLLEFIPGLQSLVDTFYKMTDAIGITHKATTKVLDDNIKKTKELTEVTSDYYDKEIGLAKAAGLETYALEQRKREEVIATLDEQIHALNLKDAAEGKATESSKDLIKQRRKLQDEWEIAEVASYKRAKDEEQKLLEERKRLNAESLKETLKRLELEEKLFYNKIGAERKAEQDAAAEREKERLAAEKAYLDKQADLDKEFASLAKEQRQKDLDDEIAKNKKAVDDKKKSEDAKKQAVTVGLNAAATLTAAFFAFQLNGAKGNAKEELRIRKQMFEVDKAFNVARAIQDGIRSVQAALTIPPPGGQILAGVNAGLAAANVAKILATKFDGGTSGGDASGGGISTGGGGAIPNTSASVPAAPQFNQTTLNGGTNDQTINNQQLTVRAYVVESEISQSQKIVERIKRTSKFG